MSLTGCGSPQQLPPPAPEIVTIETTSFRSLPEECFVDLDVPIPQRGQDNGELAEAYRYVLQQSVIRGPIAECCRTLSAGGQCNLEDVR